MTCNQGSNHGCFSDGFGTRRHGNGMVNCKNFGPFTAIDAACIVPPAITGALIPFASGLVPLVLTTAIGDLVSTGGLIGFGTSVPTAGLLGNTIDLSSVLTGSLLNEAFSVPRPGTVTAISAAFTITVAATLLGTSTVNARIYRAPAGTNIFTATDVAVTLAPDIGLLAAGALVEGSSSNFAPLSVNTGDRLLMVFSTTTTGILTAAGAVTGAASAGITIA
ncbi:exosporium glycoprotein BclB-related protein [Sporosarcina sp. NPDC096371]|uniref:exosporium glycoprotein BclB-related protein n=1 Tax=Sporosarcina sp. NPDC096371 TaxID=3364530 RepID=UPI00380A0624